MIQLIVGLGNPGSAYENTRHNAGQWFVSRVLQKYAASLNNNKKLHCALTSINVDGNECYIMQPNTYMNNSGIAVALVAKFYKIPVQNILIVHDELDIAPGEVRLKYDGGAGGHNGLKDIAQHLKSPQFHRLRIGIGRSAEQISTNYVLKAPAKAERTLIDDAVESALAQLPSIVAGDFAQVMNVLHTKE